MLFINIKLYSYVDNYYLDLSVTYKIEIVKDKRILYKGFKTAFIGYDKLISYSEENLILLE